MNTPKKLYYTKIEVDGRCVDLLLSEKEVAKGSNRVIDPKNNKFIPENVNTCWPVEQPPKCSFWDRIIGNCNCRKD
jgi:hypothetical protein